MPITKPDMEFIWASGGAVVEPSDVKKQTGWTAEVPPHQWENWIQKRQDEYLAHINERGIAEWDNNTNYLAGGLSYVQGSDGKIYKSVAASGPSTTVQNPVTDATDTHWTIAFADVGAFLTQTAGDARYTQRANNLSDLINVATARTNLGAAPTVSPAFTGTPAAPTAPVGTNTTQLATTAFVQSQVNATALGVGQTWQNLTASRANNTNYTNTTGRPIMLIVHAAISENSVVLSLTVGGIVVSNAQWTLSSGSVNERREVSAIVPAGTIYSVTYSNITDLVWVELR